MKKHLLTAASTVALVFGISLKSQFNTKYKELVDNKDTNKIVTEVRKDSQSKHPIKYLSYDMLNQWKLAANLLVSDAKADAAFDQITHQDTTETLVKYAEDLKKLVGKFYEQAWILVEQYPIYSYKKPLFKTKQQYTEDEKNSARVKIQKTAQELGTIARGIRGIFIRTEGLKETAQKMQLTAAEKETYRLVSDFAKKMSDIAHALENEVKTLK